MDAAILLLVSFLVFFLLIGGIVFAAKAADARAAAARAQAAWAENAAARNEAHENRASISRAEKIDAGINSASRVDGPSQLSNTRQEDQGGTRRWKGEVYVRGSASLCGFPALFG